MNGAERGPDAVGAMVKSLVTHLHGGRGSDQVPPSLSLCHRESCATSTSERVYSCFVYHDSEACGPWPIRIHWKFPDGSSPLDDTGPGI